MSGPKDINSIFRDAVRMKLDCPLCAETGFSGGIKLWDHAKQIHNEIWRDLASPEEEEDAKKQFIQTAQNRASSSSHPGKLGLKRGPPDTKAQVGSSRRMDIPGFTLDDKTDQQASSFGKQPPDQGKLISSADTWRMAPNPEDIANVAARSELAMHSTVDERLARVSYGPLPQEKDTTESQREKVVDMNAVASHPATPDPKVNDFDGFNSNANLGYRKSKLKTQINTSPQNISREGNRRQVASEAGIRARGNDLPKPWTILQPQSNIADPYGYEQHTFVQEKEMTVDDAEDDPEPNIQMLLQPETRPISHDQLVVEVKGIYAGLVIVEAKCIAVDEKQSINNQGDTSGQGTLKHGQWQTLIALHKQLLHEHHDFFLASQHPSASPNLSKLAQKYSMPARMWRHGIHAFLEVLRHRLPESFEHMLAFIYIAYSMMALLYETVPAFEDTWIECLGDLGRYRMAIEDDEPKDRDVWSGVARYWYLKAADKNPTVGRLYHHLAILARPYTLEQLSFYNRSLTCVTPFESARGSIMTVFNPVLNGREAGHHKAPSMEHRVIKAHGLLFLSTQETLKELNDVLRELKDRGKRLVEEFVEKNGVRFKRTGVFLAVSNFAALFEFGALTANGAPRSRLRRAYNQAGDLRDTYASTGEPASPNTASPEPKPGKSNLPSPSSLTDEEIETSNAVLDLASDLTFSIFEIVLTMSDQDANHILPMVHVTLVFIYSVSSIPEIMNRLENAIPWAAICSYLARLKLDDSLMEIMWDGKTFPSAIGTTGRPPPDDYIIRGQVYTQWFFPDTWFADAKVDEVEQMLEQSSHDAYRIIRVFWLAARLCSRNRWIQFNKETKSFTPTELATKNFTSTLEAARIPHNIEENDQIGQMSEVEEVDDADAMSDVVAEPFHRSNSTTRTNTGSTGNTDFTTATTVRQDSFNAPKANDLEEPEDTPMRDISPGKDRASPVSTAPARNEKSSRPIGPPANFGALPLQKPTADYERGMEGPQIVSDDNDP